MATYTSHLNLKLPDYSDTADIKDLNDNFKKIDDAIASGGTGGGTGGGIVTETDPTVPSWAKQPQKPTYTAYEVGALPNTTVIPTVPNALKNPYPLTINGIAYDGSEAKTVTIEPTGGGSSVELDTTLTQSGKAADAKAVGDQLRALNEANATQDTEIAKKANDSDLAKVAKSGSYTDLTNKPEIPTVPTTLPNPNKLILSGAVTAEYDGSRQVSVEIPEGGAGGAYPVVEMTAAIAELAPNTFYKWGEIAALSITLATPTNEAITNEYCLEFISGSTATTLTVPDTIRWAQEPSIEAGKTYQVSILNNVGVICGA